MNKKSNYIIYAVIVLAVSFYAFLTGCKGSSSSDNPVAVYYNSDSQTPQTINVNITQDGRVVRTPAPSGKMTLEANEQNTFNSDILLKITESQSVGNESTLLTIGSFIYNITATKDGLPVNLLNHPMTITLYNEERLLGAENYYIGIKDINGGDWQFVNLYSANPSVRTSTSNTNLFTYRLYKNNILIALFADVKKSLQSTPKVFGLVASLTPASIATEDSKYTENLRVNLLLSGENLSGLTADNFKIKVAYLTSDSHDTAIKTDNKTVNYLSGSGSNKYEGFGQGYAHYFQFTPISNNFTGGFTPNVAFDINLEGTNLSAFPTSFIVEISNADSKTLPFGYSAKLNFAAIESSTNTDTNTSSETNTDTETETNTDTNTGSNTETGTNTSTDPQPEPKAVVSFKSPTADFPVTASTIELEFSKDVPWVQNDQSKITIDNNAEIANCSYSDKILTLTLKNRLSYSKTYSLSISNLAYAEDNSFTFTTEGKASVSLKSASENFPINGTPVELELSKDIPWTADKAANISIDNEVSIISCQYNNKILTLGFSDKLEYSKTYKISVSSLEGVIDNDQLTFTTESLCVTPVISSSSQNIAANTEGKLSILQPKFYVNFGKRIASSVMALSSIKFNGNALPKSCRVVFDAASQTATIQFTEDLEYYTEYQLSADGFTDEDGAVINEASTITFKTVYPLEIIGSGTAEDPFLLFTETHLRKLCESSPVNYLSGGFYFKQMEDITLAGNWSPIGNQSSPFVGNYNGNNKFISGMRLNSNSAVYVGLFGKISDSNITDLTIKDVDISGGYQYIGSLAGYSINSTIENIQLKDNITVKILGYYSGGLLGCSENSNITNVSAEGVINVEAGYSGAGGLIGIISNPNEHTISNCYVVSNTGLIKGNSSVGGLFGNVVNKVTITNCYSKIPITGTENVGGLTGSVYSGGNITNSFSNSTITVKNSAECIGGLVGYIESNVSIISNSYAAGTIYLDCSNASYVGVTLGYLKKIASIENTFSSVSISVADGYLPTSAQHYTPSDVDTPLWYQGTGYCNNASGTNYVSEGYKESLNWDSAIWDNLTEGAMPTLKGEN